MRIRSKWIHVLCLAAAFVSAAFSGESHDDRAGALYSPADDVMAEIDALLDQAQRDDRLALIVVGANWCHDSRALAARLGTAPLSDLASEHFQTLYVDVGFYERGFDVLNRFGSPIYYATPTVLIVDPAHERVLNNADRHVWGNAAALSMDESVEYFRRYANTPDNADVLPPHARIDAFETALADRVRAGYAVVGPMLMADVLHDQPPPDINERWTELAEFRNAIPEAILRLRRQAQTSPGRELQYPEFPPLSWE